jgi:hypothetical protein
MIVTHPWQQNSPSRRPDGRQDAARGRTDVRWMTARSRRIHRREARPAAPALAPPSSQRAAVFPSASPSATSAACKARAEERNLGSMWDSWLARMERIQPRRLNLIMSCSFSWASKPLARRLRCEIDAERGPRPAGRSSRLETAPVLGERLSPAPDSAPGSERASVRAAGKRPSLREQPGMDNVDSFRRSRPFAVEGPAPARFRSGGRIPL